MVGIGISVFRMAKEFDWERQGGGTCVINSQDQVGQWGVEQQCLEGGLTPKLLTDGGEGLIWSGRVGLCQYKHHGKGHVRR